MNRLTLGDDLDQSSNFCIFHIYSIALAVHTSHTIIFRASAGWRNMRVPLGNLKLWLCHPDRAAMKQFSEGKVGQAWPLHAHVVLNEKNNMDPSQTWDPIVALVYALPTHTHTYRKCVLKTVNVLLRMANHKHNSREMLLTAPWNPLSL